MAAEYPAFVSTQWFLRDVDVGVDALQCVFKTALDLIPLGVVVANKNCEILFSNQAAQLIFEKNTALQFCNNSMKVSRLGESGRLCSAIKKASRFGKSQILFFERHSGRPLQVLVKPSVPQGYVSKQVLLIIADPEQNNVDENTLRNLYDLTLSESRVASLIVQGFSIDEASGELGVSRETIRAHLKVVFAKTKTGRQAELVGLVLKSIFFS